MWQMPHSIRFATSSARRDVAAEHGSREPVLGVVGDTHGVLVVLGAQHDDDRTERFLAVDAHRRRHAVEHGGGHDGAVDFAAGDERRALRQRVVDERAHMRDRVPVDQRAEHHVAFARIAGRQRARLGGEFLDESVGDLLVDHDALGRHADLSLIDEGAERGRVHRGVEVGVVEHDQRRLAAELEQDRLEVARRGFRDQPPGAGRAGEADAPHRRVRDQRLDHLAGVLRRIGHHVDDAVRQAGVAQRGADQPMGRRTELGGLEDHGVAAGERHRDRPHAEDDRRVPRRDAEHDAGRLPHRHGRCGRARSDGITSPVIWVVMAAASRSMPAASRTLNSHQAGGGADLGHHRLGEVFGARLDHVGGGKKHGAPLARAQRRPGGETRATPLRRPRSRPRWWPPQPRSPPGR